MSTTRQTRVSPKMESIGGQTHEVTIERIVPGGWGLAHADRRTFFVDLAAPGDLALIRIDRVQGRVAFASIVELIAPSPDRIEPPYPEATEAGADFQHLTGEAQRGAKVDIVRDCLQRIAGIKTLPDIPVVPAPQPWGYRMVAEWHHDPVRGVLGAFRRGSREVLDIEHDPLVLPALNDVLDDLRRHLRAGTLPASVPTLRAAAGDDTAAFVPTLDGSEPPELIRTVGDETYRFDPRGFFQVHPALLPGLIAETHRNLPDEKQHALDLYGGVGVFALPLARHFARVTMVESHPVAAQYAVRNAEAAGLHNVQVQGQPVQDWLAARSRRTHPSFALLDPPRSGAGPTVVAGLLRLKPERITYVSCDPPTLARDLRGLLAGGYRLDRVVAFDMFPQTHHAEAVAHLIRNE
ncbi:MAG TPA: class I SAM-dependent RNA methyltransferase [Thermomicrobiales bacterium]|nr:class I SAM-dependent RNA methyltransferase [Thermomicrobiales bacterium]